MKRKVSSPSLKYLLDRNNVRLFLALLRAEKELEKLLGGEGA